MRLKRATVYAALFLLLGSVAIYETALANNDPASAPTAGCSFATGDVALMAATVNMAGRTEVRLRWMTKRGWTPNVAFNLYRIGVDQKRQLMHVEPLGGKAGTAQISPTNTPRVAPEFKYTETLTLARRPLSPNARTVVSSAPIQRYESSQAFASMRDTIKQLRAQQRKGPALLPQAFREQVLKAEGVRPYMETLRKGNPSVDVNQKGAVQVMPPAEEDRTVEARSTLQFAALIHPEIGHDLGFAFEDQTAQVGASYTYELRSVENGQECAVPVASIPFTVGKDQPIPAVTNLVAAQLDEDSVDLRWSRPANETALLPTYKITRIDSKGSRETSRPIVVADMRLKVPQVLPDGRQVTHVEPRAFYNDRGVAPGKVTYSVTMTDIFGRESAPATLAFTMEDWHTPVQTEKIWAELIKGDDVRVSWTASSENGVGYRVYRVDAEKPDAKPVLVTTTGAIGGEQTQIPEEIKTMLTPRRPSPGTSPSRRGAASTAVQRSAERREPNRTVPANWLAFTDKAVPKDHSYRYLVTVVYQNRNDLDSVATYSRVLPVPVTTLLAGPSNLRFKLVSSVPESKVKARMEIRAARPRETNSGGIIQLGWDKVPGAKLYRIYRANASGYFNSSRFASTTSPGNSEQERASQASRAIESQPSSATRQVARPARAAEPASTVVREGVSANLNLRAGAFLNLSHRDIQSRGAMLRYTSEIDADSIPDSSYALVGQVNDVNVFYDYFPRSQAHTYAYRVVAVNRWNVPAPGMAKDAKYSSIKVPVPATLPPGAPVLLSVAPDKDGYLQLKIQGNLENQGVVRYHIFRRDMPLSLVFVEVQAVMPTSNAKINPPAMRVVHPVSNAISQRPVYQARDVEARSVPVSRLFFERSDYQELTRINAQSGAGKKLLDAKGQVTFRDDTVVPMHEYFYYVVADNGQDKYESKPSNILNGMPPKVRADAPTGLKASPALAGVYLSWGATAPDALYIVQRAQGSTENFVQLRGASSQITYTDYSALRGHTYIYRIIAIEKTGHTSDPSAYPLDKPNKNPDAYPARVKITVELPKTNPKP